MVFVRSIVILVFAGLIGAHGAFAQSPKALLNNPGHWGAFKLAEKAGLACYMAGKPTKSRPKGVKRGDIWLLVTHRPNSKSRNVVSIHIGYPFKEGSKAVFDIDKKKFELFTDGETAWAETSKLDSEIVEAMRKGSKLVVTGVSSRGTKTSDEFSLKGFTAAHKAINRACNVK